MSKPDLRRSHWLRGNAASSYPRRLICFDSESRTAFDGSTERHTFRNACATYDRINRETKQPENSDRASFDSPEKLWKWVSSKTQSKARTVVFAHNLGFDLRITRALEILPLLGWELHAISLDNYRCWARFKHGERSLVMVDTMSFLGAGLDKLSGDVHMHKPPLPRWDDTPETWEARCMADTLILRELVLRILHWLETNDCGQFRMTGAAQSSAHFRHRFLNGSRLLIHDDEAALEAERTASWTGRCEVYRHGEIEQTITEWDYSLAYARIARDAELPVRLRGSVGPLTAEKYDALSNELAILAECVVETEAPVVPAAHDGRMLWPIGSFTTTLWDCELRAAQAAGARIRVRKAWLYERGPLLQEWARWILDRQEGDNPEADPIGRRILKAWSRSLIGRFGLRYPVLDEIGAADSHDLAWMPGHDADTQEPCYYLRIGRQVFEQGALQESADSAPAIMSYILALARVRLNHALALVPPESLVYVDTDSILVTDDGNAACEEISRMPYHEGLRVKGRYKRATVYAPRRIHLEGDLRVAGLPKTAKRTGPYTFEATTWEGPRESIRQGRPAEVHVRRRPFTLSPTDHRRVQLPDGSTQPYRLPLPA
jgi:hypothetical protein